MIDGSRGKIPGRNNKSAAAAGTNMVEDKEEDVARTTGCASSATTGGGDKEVNKKKNTVEGTFIVRLMDGSRGKIPIRSDKSAAAAGTSVDEDPDEDVARTTTGCVSPRVAETRK